MIPSLTQLKTCSSIRRCRRQRRPCRRRRVHSALLGCFYAGWLSIRNRAAEKLSTVPTLSHAGSQSQDTWPSVRPPACPPPSRSEAGRRPIGAGIAVRKDGGLARRGGGADGRTDGSPLSPPLRTHAGQRRRAGKRQAVRRTSERALHNARSSALCIRMGSHLKYQFYTKLT